MYLLRYGAMREAIDPARRLVKLVMPYLWKEAWPEGVGAWEPGHEIRSEALGISLFTTGTREKLHYHEMRWELYQVLEGELAIAVKRFPSDAWQRVALGPHDMLLLPPGVFHLVDASCRHITQVIQAPPVLSDQVVVESPQEREAALAVLKGG